ncbi:MAG: YscO family type III secretion system apparatus protein [Acetobacteraceae bacterium]|nr:YscO family type III secretion system apparatus protein [Pseudomonadota bacterium]
MNADAIRPLLRIKQLRADKAEDEHRLRLAQHRAALAEVEAANQALEAWRADMPVKQAAIYDAVIGRVVDLNALDTVQERLIALREHERVLQQRLLELQKAAQQAAAAADEARTRAAEARRNVSKFEEVVDVLRRASLAEAERREDSELEEFARASGGDDGDDEGNDEWGDAA